MAITASKLRENIYRLLDQVLNTGVPIEVKRRGKILKIIRTHFGIDSIEGLKILSTYPSS